MNIHASAIEQAVPVQQFKVGDFVRINDSETVGRVVEDTNDRGSTTAKIFDDDSWGENPKFGPNTLTMWTPTPAMPAGPSQRSPAPRIIEHPIDVELAFKLLLKISGGTELVGRLAAQSDLIQSNDLEFIHSTIDPLLGQLFQMFEDEQIRQEALSVADEN